MVKLVIEYNVLQVFSPFLLGYCNCGCGDRVRYRKNRLNKFITGHHNKLQATGADSPYWRGGRTNERNGYWELLMPDYFCASSRGYVLEHVYFFQEFHDVCVCKWAVVHHIDGNKENNMPWNLVAMSREDHMRLHMTKNMDDRFCSDCDSKETYINPANGYHVWSNDHKGGFLCSRCSQRIAYYKKRNKIRKV